MILRTLALALVACLAACAPSGEEGEGEDEGLVVGGDALSWGNPVLRDPIAVFIDGEDLPPYQGRSFSGLIQIGSSPRYTFVRGTLRLTLQVKRGSTAAVRGCALAFSTEGLSQRQIRAKEAEAARACAKPSELLQGREGWVLREATPTPDLSQLSVDATPWIGPNRRLLLFFELDGNGIVSQYMFGNAT